MDSCFLRRPDTFYLGRSLGVLKGREIPRFIEPGWSIPESRQMRYNVKGTPRNSTYERKPGYNGARTVYILNFPPSPAFAQDSWKD